MKVTVALRGTLKKLFGGPTEKVVEGMVRDVVLGLAENLKGYEEGKEIVIRIK